VTLTEFYDACARFDWFYEMSDDHRVWSAGPAARHKLLEEAKTEPAKMQVFDAWQRHVFSGEPFGTQKVTKPERPVEAA
jgi:hypothetical protein